MITCVYRSTGCCSEMSYVHISPLHAHEHTHTTFQTLGIVINILTAFV